MQKAFWPSWEKSLTRWGMELLAPILLEHARPLMLMAGQMMFLGLPLFNPSSFNAQYTAILELLEDESLAVQFSQYLRREEI